MIDVIYITPLSTFPYPLHSDTLFGAICYGIKEIFGEGEVNKLEEPRFLISSAFPYSGSSKKEHFFPKIIFPPRKVSAELIENLKEYKKVKFIHESIFKKLVSGELSEVEVIENIDDYIIREGILLPKDIEFPKFRHLDTPRNVINRLTLKSEDFFYTSGISFENGGIFFLIKYIEDYREKVKASLRFLEERGIGRDISTGKGGFKFEHGSMEISEPDGEFFTTLSLYHPTREELSKFQNNIWYEIVRREGKCSDGISKKAIFMFREGSLFPEIGKKIYGEIKRVRHSPQVFQYGLAFPVRVRKNEA